MVSLEEVKKYLRVDSSDDDHLLSTLIQMSATLCQQVARLEEEEDLCEYEDIVRVAILYAVAYLYEHREEAKMNELTVTLRSLLFGIRKECF